MEKENECPCPNNDCERHSSCVPCNLYHKTKSKPACCQRPETDSSTELLARVSARLELAGLGAIVGKSAQL